MKKTGSTIRRLLLTALGVFGIASATTAQTTPKSQMEKLDRGLVVVPAEGSGMLVSWRYLGTDDQRHVSFDVLCNGSAVASNVRTKTNYQHTGGKATDKYKIVTKIDDVAVSTTDEVTPWTTPYLSLKLNRPTASDCTYSPNDMSVGDVDGDGRYELFVKWDPDNSKDNSQSGITGNVFLDCYTLTGKQLWRVDLGRNIRAGAHYTQFMVYDFDGDGKAEMICKTAPGSIDGTGQYVNQASTVDAIRNASNTKSWVTSDGRINGGHEYLTVFEGLTGKAINTIAYNPNRNTTSSLSEAEGTFNWDDRSGKTDKGSYGNRGERYLACVAALDGPDAPPSAVFCRGYYTYAYVWAVDFDGTQLKPRWLHKSASKTSYSVVNYQTSATGTTKTYTPPASTSGGGSRTLYANGNHNISVADVDGDGKDEIIYGSAALDDDGKLLYAVGFGHGDAIHMSDLDPSRPGLEVFDVHEEKGTYSWDVHDAATGEIIHKGGNSGVDNGRGIAAQLDASHYGFYFSSSDERSQRSAVTGEIVNSKSTSLNFRIYWDGDLQDELLDGNTIDKWNGNGTSRVYIKSKNPYDYANSSTCNSTKKTPNLSADIFGDWREELILWNSADGATLNIFSSNRPSDFLVPTLMHDHTYRLGVAWQNVAYNQPPHLGYYLPDRFHTRLAAFDKEEETTEWTVKKGEAMEPVKIALINCGVLAYVDSTFTPTKQIKGLSTEFKSALDSKNRCITINGIPTEAGDYTITIRTSGNTLYPGNIILPITIHVKDDTELPGDANNDNKVTMADANMVARYVLDSTAPLTNKRNADVNNDGKIDINDAYEIVNIYLAK